MRVLGKDDFIRFAEKLWNVVTNKGTVPLPTQGFEIFRSAHRTLIDQHVRAIERITSRGGMGTQEEEDTIRWATLLNMFNEMPDGRMLVVVATKWADCGFPQITMGHKYAAALLATNVTKDVFPFIRRPWPAFMVEIPNGLLSMSDPDSDQQIPVQRILVAEVVDRSPARSQSEDGTYWAYFAMTDSTLSLWRFGVSTDELLPENLEDNPLINISYEITEQDGRVSSLIGRMIVNVCLAMNDQDQIRKTGPGHKRYQSAQTNERRGTFPTVRTFQLGKPVDLDFREHVQKYIRDGHKSGQLTVQSLIAGHFKRVHFGELHSKTKVSWISPYWKGPEDSPILLRAHKLPEKQ